MTDPKTPEQLKAEFDAAADAYDAAEAAAAEAYAAAEDAYRAAEAETYGKEIRSLFVPREGYIRAGFDAAAAYNKARKAQENSND